MPSAFDVLAKDHEEVKQMLAELERGPAAVTGAVPHQLALRKEMVQQLVIEESKHEAVEEMYFWPAVRKHLDGGDDLASRAQGQEQDGKVILDRLDKLAPEDEEFEALLRQFISTGNQHGPGAHRVRGDSRLALSAGGTDRRRSGQPRARTRGRQEDRPDPAAPEHPGQHCGHFGHTSRPVS
jgi:hypothetical protein